MIPATGALIYQPYAMLRRGENTWDGWYDLLQNDGRQVRSFVRVPSQEGFADPDLACQAAEILAQWDLERRENPRKPRSA